MLEIVVQVLPIMLNQEYNEAKIKTKVLENFPSIGEKIWKTITNSNNNILQDIQNKTFDMKSK